MSSNPKNSDLQKIAASLCDLITVLIRIFPESESEELEKEIYLTILHKAQEDANALKAALHAQNN